MLFGTDKINRCKHATAPPDFGFVPPVCWPATK